MTRLFPANEFSQEGEEEAPPPSPQPKTTKVPPETKPKPATPPPVIASVTREEEDEGDKIMAELQVRCVWTQKQTHTTTQTNVQTQSKNATSAGFCWFVRCGSGLPVISSCGGWLQNWQRMGTDSCQRSYLHSTLVPLGFYSCGSSNHTQTSSLLKILVPMSPLTFLHSSGFPEVHS